MQDPKPTVLLVDDEIGTIELLGAVLEGQGFQVTLARSARDAILWLEERAFDAVVSDVVFEGSSEGEQVLAACRRLHPEAAAFLMQSFSRPTT